MDTHRINRILVALDGSCQSDACPYVASELAAKMNIELQGLFVEDLDLINLATLPFTRQIRSLSATEATFDLDRVEQDMKLQARQAQQILAGMAKINEIAWSFRVVRGRISQEVQRASENTDLIVASVSQHMSVASYSPGYRTVARVLNQCAGNVILMPEKATIAPPFVVLIEPHLVLDPMLKTLIAVADGKGTEFQFILATDQDNVAADMQSQLGTLLDHKEHTLLFTRLRRCNAYYLNIVLHTLRPGTIVVHRDSVICDAAKIQQLMNESNRPILVVGSV